MNSWTSEGEALYLGLGRKFNKVKVSAWLIAGMDYKGKDHLHIE